MKHVCTPHYGEIFSVFHLETSFKEIVFWYLLSSSFCKAFTCSTNPAELHQENGCQLFFDAPISLLFLTYFALYCHFWPVDFYDFTA